MYTDVRTYKIGKHCICMHTFLKMIQPPQFKFIILEMFAEEWHITQQQGLLCVYQYPWQLLSAPHGRGWLVRLTVYLFIYALPLEVPPKLWVWLHVELLRSELSVLRERFGKWRDIPSNHTTVGICICGPDIREELIHLTADVII